TGNILKITNNSNATEIDLSGYTNIDDQRVSLSGNVLTLGNGTGADTMVDLSGYLDNTDNQNLTGATIDGNNILTIGIENGDAVTVDLSGFMDNTDNQELSIVGDQLSIDGGNTVTLPTADGTETKVTAGTNVSVSGDGSISDPYVVGVASLDDADSDPTNEIQDLDLTGNILKITNNSNATEIDLSGYTNIDDQRVSLSGNVLTLGNGTGADTTVDLSGYLDNTDNQELSIVGDQLSIDGGNTVTLPTADGTETR